MDSLKKDLLKVWDDIKVEQLPAILGNFPKRLNACVSAVDEHSKSSFRMLLQ